MASMAHSTPPITEIDVLWITAGLGCDGDTIAMTAATQPSIEDVVRGGIPWIPKVNFHNPFLSFGLMTFRCGQADLLKMLLMRGQHDSQHDYCRN